MIYKVILATVKVLAGVMLLLAIGNWSNHFYEILRDVIFIISATVVFQSFNNKHVVWAWFFLSVAILFNPIYPIYLQNDIWKIIDIIVAISFFASISTDFSQRSGVFKKTNKLKQIRRSFIGAKNVLFRIFSAIGRVFIHNILKIILLFVIVIFLICGLFFLSFTPPEIQTVANITGSSVTISGKAFSLSKVQIYVNDSYLESIKPKEDGTFSKELEFNVEGQKRIMTKQSFLIFNTGYSDTITTTTDLTPPNNKNFNLTSSLPSSTTKKNLMITATMRTEDSVNINGKEYKPNADGVFDATVSLEEGDNRLRFKLSDSYGNFSKVFIDKTVNLDTKVPTIKDKAISMLCGYLWPSEAHDKDVCIKIGNWTGYIDAYVSTPIVGSIGSKIKSVTVDGKNIQWDKNGDVYSRITLYIYGGLNKYKVVATDTSGNVATGYISTTSERN